MQLRLCSARALALGALSLSLFGAPAGADIPAVGFGLTPLPYPLASKTATLADGRIVAFDGEHVDLFDANGVLTTNLGVLPNPGFPSFLVLNPSQDMVLFGESSFGGIYTINLSPGAPQLVTSLTFNYDAVFEDDEHVIVSAATAGFGNGNRIYRVDLLSGAATLLASVAGASGPVTLDLGGDLIYGTVSDVFPSPPGSSSVLRWPAAALTGAPVLTESDATILESGFDGAADLVLDPLGGGLYLAENNYGSGVNRIRLVAGNPLIPPILLEGIVGRTISNLEFLPGDGRALFAGFQPPSGGTMLYSTTDFFTTYERHALEARRPALFLSGPGVTGTGPFQVDVTDAPRNGFAYLFYAPTTSVLANELVLPLRLPLFLGLAPAAAARVPGTMPIGPSGSGHLGFTSPGGLAGNWALQAVLFDSAGRVTASSGVTYFQ
jgi:hypothetical protein